MSASREKRLRRELREAEANSDIVKKVKKKKPQMNIVRARKIRSAIYSAVAIIVVVVLALLIFVNSGYMQAHATALTVGSHNVTPTEFNYFYQDTYYNVYSTYSSYGLWNYMVDTTRPIASQECFASDAGQTWAEYLTDTAAQTALQTYALYDAAMADGYELSEETKANIESTRETLTAYAEASDFKDADAYLAASYGKGADVESYLNYITVQQIATGYAAQKQESFTYTDDQLRDYYNENAQTYDKVTYRIFSVATTDGDTDAAKETADAMKAELNSTEDSFIKAAASYAPEDQAASYEDESYTLRRGYTYSSCSSDYADWLFSDKRVAGESEVFVTESGYSVVMFVSRDNNDYETTNVRHILVKVGATGEDGTSTTEDWDACLASIEEIQALWEETAMTEDDFAKLADEHSEDTGSASNGGLIEGIYKGQMVSEFEDWCFGDGRQNGDTGIVKTSYGYHLMYFSGTGDLYWKSLADSGIRAEDYAAWYTGYSADYTAQTKSLGQWFTTKNLPSLSAATSY